MLICTFISNNFGVNTFLRNPSLLKKEAKIGNGFEGNQTIEVLTSGNSETSRKIS